MKSMMYFRIIAVLLLWVAPVLATTYLEYSLDDMLTRAEVIVFAEVTEVASNVRDDTVWTDVALEPIRVLKGEDDIAAASIAFYGGRAEGRSVDVEGMPRLNVGEQVLILRYDNEGYVSPLVGFSQGLWTLRAQGFTDMQSRILAVDATGVLGFVQDFQAALEPASDTVQDFSDPLEPLNEEDTSLIDAVTENFPSLEDLDLPETEKEILDTVGTFLDTPTTDDIVNLVQDEVNQDVDQEIREEGDQDIPVVSGDEAKPEDVADVSTENVVPENPATEIQFDVDTTLVLDAIAARLLELEENR